MAYVDCIKVHTVKDSRLDGLKLEDFLDNFEGETLYILDIDSYNRREMNLKIYDELSGLFELWIDAAPRRHYDVMDILVIGGNKAIIDSNFIKYREVEKILELTDNVILKSYDRERLENFIMLGGREVITSKKLADYINAKTYIMKGGELCLWKN